QNYERRTQGGRGWKETGFAFVHVEMAAESLHEALIVLRRPRSLLQQSFGLGSGVRPESAAAVMKILCHDDIRPQRRQSCRERLVVVERQQRRDADTDRDSCSLNFSEGLPPLLQRRRF